MFKGIIFDFDGLIIDTETPQFNAFNELFNAYNTELPIELWLNEVGTDSDFDSIAYLEKKLGVSVDRSKIRKKIKHNIQKKINSQELRENMIEFLDAAKEMDFKIGLASSSNFKWVNHFLKKFAIKGYFDSIKTSNDVELVKPDPELYLKVAEELQLHPTDCLVFEDSVNGLKAAKSAKMTCVVVPNELTSHSNFENYDFKINSMADISLEKLIEKIKKGNVVK